MDTVEEKLPLDQTTADQQDKPLSLVDTITLMLTEAGVTDPEAWKTDLHPETYTSPDVNIQRFHMNRHWRFLMAENKTREQIAATRNARGCLVDGRWELADWIFHFKKDVIPAAIEVGVVTVKQDEPA